MIFISANLLLKYFSIVKPTRYVNVSNLFYWTNTLHVSDGLSVHYQEFQDCMYSKRHLSNRYCCLLASKQTAVSVWLLYVQSLTPDDGRKDRPKYVVC